MAFFSKDYVDFFKELKKNNNKEWFDENRKRYEKNVKRPFNEFVTQLIAMINSDDPTITVQAKDCIFRINRDIRFSKDKTPYKERMSAAIARGGKKDYTTPGFYFELRTDGIGIYGGVWGAEKDQLMQIRHYIAENYDELESALNDPEFKSVYGTIHGDKNKVLPKDFNDVKDKYPLLYNKQFYYMAELDKKYITSDELAEKMFEYYLASKPVKEYFTNALDK